MRTLLCSPETGNSLDQWQDGMAIDHQINIYENSSNYNLRSIMITAREPETALLQLQSLRTQLQCLTEAKAHGALPPHPPSNLDRMDKNVRNLNTKFKLSEKIEKITARRFHSKI
jgi:hypothetical protein